MIMRLFGRKGQPVYSEEMGHMVRTLPPIHAHGAATEFFSIPSGDIPELVGKYIAAMETEVSEDWCRCLWQIHPDDASTKKGHCTTCTQPQGWRGHTRGHDLYDHNFTGIRKRRVDDSPDCPVHTREGMVIYFFQWVFDNASN